MDHTRSEKAQSDLLARQDSVADIGEVAQPECETGNQSFAADLIRRAHDKMSVRERYTVMLRVLGSITHTIAVPVALAKTARVRQVRAHNGGEWIQLQLER